MPGFARTCAGVAIAAALSLAGGCSRDGGGPVTPERDRPVIAAVNYPLAYFAERIAGSLAVVIFPAPPGDDPASWLPADGDIVAYQQADLVLANGAGHARWRQHSTLRDSRVVETSAGFADDLIATAAEATHAHGPAGSHEHGGVAFTTWLDLRQGAEQARAAGAAIAALLPEHRAEVEQRTRALQDELLAIDRELAAVVSVDPPPLLASHPVYQYLARRLDLDTRSVHWEPDEAPDAAAWAELESIRADHAASWMIWEGQPLAATRARLEEVGIRCVVVDPCGGRPEGDGDFMSVMRANLEGLRIVFER